jgi:hypothetical protein
VSELHTRHETNPLTTVTSSVEFFIYHLLTMYADWAFRSCRCIFTHVSWPQMPIPTGEDR